MTDFYFTRHGESQANVEHVMAGWTDSPLTEKGRLDAQAEGQRLALEGVKFDLIMSSPLSRAYDTAQAIAAPLGYPVKDIIRLDELKERCAGDYEGKPTAVLETQAPHTDPIAAAGGETYDEFSERVAKALEVIRRMSLESTSVLVVAHAGWYKMATALLEQTDTANFFMRPSPVNNSVVRFPV